jgi:hypothetical protein
MGQIFKKMGDCCNYDKEINDTQIINIKSVNNACFDPKMQLNEHAHQAHITAVKLHQECEELWN